MFSGLERRIENSYVARCIESFVAMEGLDRALVLASQAFTALIPLLIVLSALTPSKKSVSSTINAHLHLSGTAASSVTELFARPADSAGSLSVLSVGFLVFAGVSLTRRLQRLYLRAFGLPELGARGSLNAVLGLGALLVEVALLSFTRTFLHGLPLDRLVQLPLTVLSGIVLWTSIPYLLLDRRLHWRRLIPAGTLASAALALYAMATSIYMPSQIDRESRRYGLFGVTIAMVGWLLCISLVLVVATAAGAEFDRTRDPWAERVRTLLRIRIPEDSEPLLVASPATGEVSASAGTDRGDMMRRLLVNWAILAVAVAAAAVVVPGITVEGDLLTLLWVALLFGLVNAILGPLLDALALPLTLTTFGLIALVVNGLLLAATAGLSSKLDVGGFVGTMVGALVITIVSAVLATVVSPARQEQRSGR